MSDEIIWDGGGADEYWETPENWSTDAVTTWFDSVIFDGTSSKDCVVSGDVEIFDFTVTAGYVGTLHLDGVGLQEFTVNGDLLVQGGTIDGGTAWKYFRGDFTYIGGSMDASDGRVFFDGVGTQDVVLGAGGLAVNRCYFGGAGGTVNLEGLLTMTGSALSAFSVNDVLNVLDGAVIDAQLPDGYVNYGVINQIGSGVVLRNATSIGFTDADGDIVTSVPVGANVYITLADDDENIDGSVPDVTYVTVESVTTGDTETLTLTETGNYTGLFRNVSGLPTVAGPADPNDGALQQDGTEHLLVTYVDDEDPGDTVSRSYPAPPVTWDGGGADEYWQTPENWSTDTVPTWFDSVIFDGTSSKNCVISGAVEILDFTMAVDYAGTLSALDGVEFIVNGDFVMEAGTIDLGPAWKYFRGDVTYVGGSMDASDGRVFFDGSGTQNIVLPAGGLAVNRCYFGGAGGTVNLNGLLAMTGESLSAFSVNDVLNVLDGSVIDARLPDAYVNYGVINQIGSGVILRYATALSFTDSDGQRVSDVPPNAEVFVTLLDDDENTDGVLLDTASVVVESVSTGDAETLSLEETDNQTGVFRNVTGLPTEVGAASPGDGVLQQDGSEDLLVTYIDDEDSSDMRSRSLHSPSQVVWDGGGADEYWRTPENWSTDEVPTLYDDVVFDGTSGNDCVVNGNTAVFDFTMAGDYTGRLELAGSLDFVVNHNFVMEGGVINGGTAWKYFRGDFTYIGGSMDASDGRVFFDGAGTQDVVLGAGGLAVNRCYFGGAGGTVNLEGLLTMTGSALSAFSVNDVLNVLDGAVIDAQLPDGYVNYGVINQIGSGVVLRNAQAIGLTDPTGDIPTHRIFLDQPFYTKLFDDDENIDGSVSDTTLISLTNMQNGDVEWLTLTEEGQAVGVFRDDVGFPAQDAPAVSGNGILEATLGNVVAIRYQDDEDAGDMIVVFKVVTIYDCNGNGIDDEIDIASGTSEDCDENLVPDECQVPPIGDGPDCNNDGIPDVCQLEGNDENENGIPDDCEDDSDGDGVPDESDWCPDSDLQESIVIDGCDSGVANLLFDDGCTMLDLIMACAADAQNHGQFVSCVAHLTNEWKQAGLITGQEKGRIQSCAGQADIP